MQETMQETIMYYLLTYGLSVLAAVIILFAGLLAAKLLRNLANRFMEKRRIDPMIAAFLATILYILMILFVIIAALSKLGIQTTSLIAAVGAAGLAIGLALQGSLSNLAAGVIIITLRPFKIGDYVEAGTDSGTVESIQLFHTKLLTPDNKEVTVPNSTITSTSIVNYTARSERRVDMVFGIAYDDDVARTRQIILNLLSSDERVLKDPAPAIVLGELDDSSVNLWVRPWTKTEDYWEFKWDFTEALKKRFDEEDITIPFPQRDVHLYQDTDQTARPPLSAA